MHELKIDTGYGEILLVGDKLHEGHDFLVKANAPLDEVEVVLFFDSRGISKDWESSLLKMLVEYFGAKNYLAIARPLDLTIWATLYNFFHWNRIFPQLLITNVGLVDFTPKKLSFCHAMVEQVAFTCETESSEILPMENYRLSSGREEMLFSVNYPDRFKLLLRDFLHATPTIAVKTPLLDPGIRIERKRPASFFAQLRKTNEFIDELSCTCTTPGCFDERQTYDGVHWTQAGNKLIFDKIIRQL